MEDVREDMITGSPEASDLGLYSVKIPVFEGPLDLLLHLIKENKIDIYDIPIALITRQYLEYLEMMRELNLDIASEFLVMAATLIYIKSRMLLPKDESGEVMEEDPRLELVQRLIEYQAMKEAALGLKEREEEWSGVVSRPSMGLEDEPEELLLFDVNIFDLLTAFKKLLDRLPPETIQITAETLTVKDRISHILNILEQRESVSFDDLFEGLKTRDSLIVTFLAVLELLKLGLIRAYQERAFSMIWIFKKDSQTNEISIIEKK
ncbi:MAG: segregation and condensation protein A [Thermodesulfovibrionales bacterium]